MPGDSPTLDPAAISSFDGEPIQLIPVIRDILQTRYCIPGTIFLVEGLDTVPLSSSGRWMAVRLLLGDGELCIQALLGGGMFHFIETGEIARGSYVRCHAFEANWHDIAPEPQEMAGKPTVYLAVRDVEVLGWNESYRIVAVEDLVQQPTKSRQNRQWQQKGVGTVVEFDEVEMGGLERLAIHTQKPESTEVAGVDQKQGVNSEEEEEAIDDAFETFGALQVHR